ncbi:MAG: ABC transporter permease [Algicola sp.]|nr:ABC transporter permease [Algicola sp.]
MGFLLDLRYALRLLAKSPKFTVLTSFILMGGLTVSLLTFNFVSTMAFKPLDTPEGNTIVTFGVSGQYPAEQILGSDIAKLGSQLQDSQLFDTLYAEYTFNYRDDARLSSDDIGMDLYVERVSSNFFDFTRFAPLLGRNFTVQDEESANNNVVAISYKVWQTLFSGDEQIIGKNVTLDTRPVQIIAVMPQGYHFPINAELWLPIDASFMHSQTARSTPIGIMARLQPDVSRERADQLLADQLSAYTYQSLTVSEQADFEEVQVKHQSVPEHKMEGATGGMFLGFQGIATIILLMACINTGNLIFARSIERQKESAIRSALGAKHGRLIRQLVCEGAILTLIGGFFAILASGWLIDVFNKAMHASTSGHLPFWFVWQMDWQTLSVALIFMAVTFVFACLLPAVKAANMDINSVLRDGTRGALGRNAGKISRILVTTQVALIACLMLGGSLGVVLMYKVMDVVADDKYTNRFQAKFDLESTHQKGEFLQNMLTQLTAQTNIVQAGMMDNRGPQNIRIDGNEQQMRVDIISSSGHGEFFDLSIGTGRDIDHKDNLNSARVCLVSQSFADRYWPQQDPTGKMLDIEIDGKMLPHRLVGVISNMGGNSQGVFAQVEHYDEVHVSYYQNPYADLHVTFGTTEQAEKGEEDFYRVVHQLDVKSLLVDFNDQAVSGNTLLKVMVLTTKVIVYAGLFSLFLALMGVYGVAASGVALRSQEIGIRRAIGAKDKAIILLFLKRNMRPLVIGLSIGLLVYTVACFIFSNMVGNRIEVSMYITIALLASLVLSFILALAAYFPTRRAIEHEPAVTLRAD